MKPLLAHLVLLLELVAAPESEIVPLVYGAGVYTGIGTTVWVLRMTTGVAVAAGVSAPAGDSVGDGASVLISFTGKELAAPSAAETGVGTAVSVTVTVNAATVTVTGTHAPSPPALEAPGAPVPAAPSAEDAAKTVIYLVEVLVPV